MERVIKMELEGEFKKLNKELININTKLNVLVNELRIDTFNVCQVCKKGYLHFQEFLYEGDQIIKIRYMCNHCNLIFEINP
jgi:hypothetical protein